MYIAIGVTVSIAALFAFCAHIKNVAAHEAMLVSLRRENAMLLRDKLNLEKRNMELRDEKTALEQQLRKVSVKQSLRDNDTADYIAALKAEIRRKDKIIDQKWMVAKGTYEAARR